MRKSYKIALSGICTALSVIFLTLGFYIRTGSLSFYTLSSLVLLLPLSKKMYGYAALTAVASALFSFLVGGLTLFIPYVLFFGIHPILTVGLRDIKKLNKIIAIVIKQIFFNGSIYLVYLITKALIIYPDYLFVYIWLTIIILNIILFIYDQLFLIFTKRAEYYIDRFGKQN